MPNHIKAYAVILFIGAISYIFLFGFSRRLGCQKDLNALFMWCFVTTSMAFLLGNYWLFVTATLILLVYTRNRRSLDFQITLYFFLLLSLPTLRQKIPGFPGMQYLFMMSWPSLLSIALLGPLLFNMKRIRSKIFHLEQSNTEDKIKATGIDKLVLVYFFYLSILSFRDTTVTNGLRESFELFIEIYLPYIVISRCVRREEDLIRIGHAVMVIILVMAVITIFSSINHWQLYQSFQRGLGGIVDSKGYLERGGALRSGGVYGPINFGMMIGVAMAFGISFFQTGLVRLKLLAPYMIILLAGLIVTYSRGPWVGVAVMLLVYLLLTSNRGNLILRTLPLTLLFILAILITDIGKKVVKMLPFVGSESEDTITYRQDLFRISIQEINENPLFGSTTFLDSDRMQELIQGQGIIDLVNTYLEIGLRYGYTGVFLFGLILLVLLYTMISVRKKLEKNNLREVKEQGVALISICVMIAIVIATVSSIGNKQVSAIIWSIFGLCAAYVRISRRKIALASDQMLSDT